MQTNSTLMNKLAILIAFIFTTLNVFSQAGSSTKSVANSTVTTGTGFNWTNAANAKIEDGNFASVALASRNNKSYLLQITDFQFQSITDIPAGASISGIVVEVKKQETGGTIRDQSVLIMKNGAAVGTAHTITTAWPTTLGYVTYGTSSDLWGQSWTAADILSAGFGIQLQCKNAGKTPAVANIDNVRITVYFNSTTYYSKAAGDLATLTTWGTAIDGTGSAPSSFTSDGQVFKIRNRNALTTTLTTPLTITGNGSKLVVGEFGVNTLVVPSGSPLTGTVDVAAASFLTLQDAAIPTLGSLDATSTVTYSAVVNQNISASSYGNLTVNTGGTKITTGITDVATNLTIGSGAIFQVDHAVTVAGNISNSGTTTGTDEITENGTVAATINGTGGTFRALGIDNSSGATLSTALTYTNYFRCLDGAVTNGANLIPATNCIINIEDGSLSAAITSANIYDVVYTSTANKSTTANELGGANLRHITISAFDNTIVITAGANITLKGDLLIASGTFNASSRTITVGGSFTNNAVFTPATSTIAFNGTSVQNISGASTITFNGLTINNTGSQVVLQRDVNVSGVSAGAFLLTLTSGVLVTNNNILAITGATSGTTFTGVTWGSTKASFISTAQANGSDGTAGGLQIQSVGTGGRTGAIIFPVGNNFTAYTPVRLTNTGTADNFTVLNTAGVPAGAILLNCVNRTWNITEDVPGGSTAVVEMQWNTAEEQAGFTAAKTNAARVFHSDGVALDAAGTAATPAGVNPFTRTSVITFSTFSPFGVGVNLTVLPVTFTNVSAKVVSGGTEIKFQNATELGMKNYQIERSLNGSDFTAVNSINAVYNNASSANYRWVDTYIATGDVYYRINAVDIAGKNIRSSIVKIKRNSGASLSVAPNPVMDKIMNVQLSAVPSGKYFINVADVNGKNIYASTINSDGGFSNNRVALPSAVTPGAYIVRMYNETGVSFTQKVIIK